ncbi:hypothetical protein QVD17_01200 [Tagetes erecta]|uniref:Uncharacterized protein n=1 Tax=Tagetes erecta TaxID=13708 RepID=A0AAD8P7X1_TARER|nr:hypothetical protein QVD17_01200 [Tagetes erecta]
MNQRTKSCPKTKEHKAARSGERGGERGTTSPAPRRRRGGPRLSSPPRHLVFFLFCSRCFPNDAPSSSTSILSPPSRLLLAAPLRPP